MRLYNIGHGSNHLQTFRKYCLQLDHQIDTLKRFIENFNANYVILNLPDTKNRTYYSPEQLVSLGILKSDLEDPETYISIDPTKMITKKTYIFMAIQLKLYLKDSRYVMMVIKLIKLLNIQLFHWQQILAVTIY